MKLHLVDGTYELFRAYYGAPGATAADGQEVGATLGLLRSMLALLRQPDVTHVACAFDHVIESFRNELFDGYKTGEGLDPILLAQFDLAEEVCQAAGLVVWSMIEFEADDALASGASRFAPEVSQVVLCSPDKDLAQCVVGQQVICYDRMRRRSLDQDGVRAKFGVEPASIPDFLALVGDAADGIPGIPRWGARSTAQVLAHYRHIEAIPPTADTWQVKPRGAAQLARNLSEHHEEALLYRQLATLRRDVPLGETLADLAWRGPRHELEPLLARLGAIDLLTTAQAMLARR